MRRIATAAHDAQKGVGMPIPSHVLGELAARYGQVDPADRQAVEDFYVALVTSGDEAIQI